MIRKTKNKTTNINVEQQFMHMPSGELQKVIHWKQQKSWHWSN